MKELYNASITDHAYSSDTSVLTVLVQLGCALEKTGSQCSYTIHATL